MIRSLVIADRLSARVLAEARRLLPRECCGLVEGIRSFDVVQAVAVHPTRNVAQAPDRFEIDPAEHIRCLRAARERGREIVGCYHSHPNGLLEPSPFDRETAGDEEFLWLIAAVSAETAELGAFVFEAGQFRRIPLKPA